MKNSNKIFILLCLLYYQNIFSQPIRQGDVITETAPVQESSEAVDSTPVQEEVIEEKEDVQSEREQRLDILQFGLDSEVSSLVSTLISEKDDTYTQELSEIFESARNTTLKDGIITYFRELEDESLKEYALYLLEDPYDEKNSTVNALIQYVGDLGVTEAGPLLVNLIDSDQSAYFNASISAIGKVGGSDEALFLVEYLENDLTTGERQSVVRALADLQAPETYDMLVEMVENEDENSYVRMYAAEAIGNIDPESSTQILVDLYDSTDPNIREYAVKGLSTNTSEDAKKLILNALKDDHYKVRLQALESIEKLELKEASAALLYRAKNDTEVVIKNKCYDLLALFNYSAGIDYMIELLEGAIVSDTVKANVSSSLLEHDSSKGVDAVIVLALQVVTDDKKKNLRYALGKEFAKHENSKFEKVCEAFLLSKDVATQGTGLDIYKKNPYLSLRSTVQSLTEGDVANSIKAKAKTILEG